MPSEQIKLGSGWSGSLFFEHMDMSSLRRGTKEVSPDQVLTERLNAGAPAFSVPTRMYMDRASAQLRYQFNPEHSLRLTIPWRFNQMDMRMASRPGAGGGGHGHAHHRIAPQMDHHNTGAEHDHHQHDEMGHEAHAEHHHAEHGGHGGMNPAAPMFMNMTMDQTDGLGDISLAYNYTFQLDDNTAWVGGGVSLPTGEWDERGGGGGLIHNMMQPGSGALGLSAEAGADLPLGDSKFSLHPRASVQWNARNPLGYQRGSRLDYELGSRYQVHERVGLSLDLVGFMAQKDTSNGTIDPVTGRVAFQSPQTSLVDDVINTGGQFLFIAPGLRANPTEDIALGIQYRLPIYQKVHGTQLGIDSWYRVFMSARF